MTAELTERQSDIAASQHGQAGCVREHIVYLAPDCTDSAVKKRAHGFLRLGHAVSCFSFRRARYDVGYQPDWPNVELGRSEERRLLSRVWTCIHALVIILRHRRTWRQATLIYARNLDLALLAVVGQWLTWSRGPLVYEVLDVHPILLGSGLKSKIAKALERFVLRRCRLLVVSSMGFVENFFEPVQHFDGEVFLLENKWSPESLAGQSRQLAYPRSNGNPEWVIGWFGNIRCHESLRILGEVADRLPGRVKIYIRGYASYLGDGALERVVEGRSNIVWGGEYRAPEELPDVYRHVHFNWCVDFSGGENGMWLLPNRLYEGGYFGVPAIAIKGHHTGDVVEQRQLGYTIGTPYVDELCELLQDMTWDSYRQAREVIERRDAEEFVDGGELGQMVRRAVAAAQ